ncbi:hypothetical protein PhCBS80983_g02037 [Powellomyces hirtus]|uniref:EF-hand domain-containing protein n=1 Tax=Powellomyces hirtus TaxID=109895 RepID=A0A507E9E8_9FUNG|nr:hypothetical protein PhCBS80983_g02037 [Powellomyces hirtus]
MAPPAGKKLDPTNVDEVWKTFDYNNNGILSLAEIDRAVIECYPAYASNKPVLIRAYKAADSSTDGFVDRKEFRRLMEFLAIFDGVYKKFKKMDADGDRRVNFEEFEKGFKEIGALGGQTPRQLFDEIDTNKGGYILFDEFCGAIAQSKLQKK